MPDTTTPDRSTDEQEEINAQLAHDHDNSKAKIDALIVDALLDAFIAGLRWMKDHPGKDPDDASKDSGDLLTPFAMSLANSLEIAYGLRLVLEHGVLIKREAVDAQISDEQAHWAMKVLSKEYCRIKETEVVLPIANELGLSVRSIAKVISIEVGAGEKLPEDIAELLAWLKKRDLDA